MKITYDIHPAANLFPMMDDEAFAALKKDIAENGLRESIVFWKNKLVDGRNRAKACEELGIQPGESELDEDQDPVAYVISANLHRRHLTTSQRAEIAAKLATKGRGGDRKSKKIKGSNDPLKIDDAAKLLNVSPASVKRAKAKGGQKGRVGKPTGKRKNTPGKSAGSDEARDKAAKLLGVSGDMVDLGSKVLAKGTPELIAAIERGDMELSRAAKIAELPAEQQAKAIEEQQNPLPLAPGMAGLMMGILTDGSTTSVLGEIMLTLEGEFKTDDDFGNPIKEADAKTLTEWKDFLQRISDLVEDAIGEIDSRLNLFGDDAGGAGE